MPVHVHDQMVKLAIARAMPLATPPHRKYASIPPRADIPPPGWKQGGKGKEERGEGEEKRGKRRRPKVPAGV